MHVSQGRMWSAHSESSAYLIGLPIFPPWQDGKYVEGACTWHSRIIVVEMSVSESQTMVILRQELNKICCFTQWVIRNSNEFLRINLDRTNQATFREMLVCVEHSFPLGSRYSAGLARHIVWSIHSRLVSGIWQGLQSISQYVQHPSPMSSHHSAGRAMPIPL